MGLPKGLNILFGRERGPYPDREIPGGLTLRDAADIDGVGIGMFRS